MRFLVLLILLFAPIAHAQTQSQSLSVTVTPPLFQLTIGPGEFWSSVLKVVNSNLYEVAYYAQVVDFQADGERGQGKFIPLMEDASEEALTHSLASWLEMSSEPVVVPAGQSGEIPFTVRVPENAEPGGHYAAILVGTQPGAFEGDGPGVSVSSFVSSLLFVRIKGDVVEQGRIREFRTGKTLYETPKADFLLRFENTGNAHLQPQGDITLFNMWGKERGKVFINQKSDFGNVLPDSTRSFEFVWEGEQSLLDIGRYSAIVTLGFGENGKQNVNATTYFWVIPVVPVAIAIGSLIVFILLLVWLIRRYIRRAVVLERQRYGGGGPETHAPPTPTLGTLMEPIREGVVDLRIIMGKQAVTPPMVQHSMSYEVPESLSAFQFISKYKGFFVFIFLVVSGSVSLWWYLEASLESKRGFEIRDVKVQEESQSVEQSTE